jgi:hypothetical protein
LVRYAYLQYLDPDEIDGCLANYVSSQEAAEMLGVEVREMEGWFQEWGLRQRRELE